MRIWIAIVAAIFPLQSWADPEPKDWDNIPQAHSMVVSEKSVTVRVRTATIFRRQEAYSCLESPLSEPLRFEPISDEKCSKIFPSPRKEDAPPRTITTSDSEPVEIRYCENASNEHCTEARGKFSGKIATVVIEDSHITAAEKVGNELWIGTTLLSDYGDLPSDGLLTYSLPGGKLKKRVSSSESHAIIREIKRIDRLKEVWVIEQYGIARHDFTGKLKSSIHLREEFDPKTGKPRVMATSEKKDSDPFAVMSRMLRVPDPLAFFKAVQSIPRDKREPVDLDFYHSLRQTAGIRQEYPEAINVLLPFAIQSGDLFEVCRYRDPRAVAFAIEAEKKSPRDYAAKTCLESLKTRGLLSPELQARRDSGLLDRIRTNLQKIHVASDDLGGSSQVQELVLQLKALKGDPKEIEAIRLINEALETFPVNRAYEDLSRSLFQLHAGEDRLMPGALASLRRNSADPFHACAYFGLAHYTARLGVEPVAAILGTLTALKRLPVSSGEVSRRETDVKECGRALSFQLDHENVRRQFEKCRLMSLPEEQKAIYRDLPKTTLKTMGPEPVCG